MNNRSINKFEKIDEESDEDCVENFNEMYMATFDLDQNNKDSYQHFNDNGTAYDRRESGLDNMSIGSLQEQTSSHITNSEKSLSSHLSYNSPRLENKDNNNAMTTSQNYVDTETGISVFVLDRNGNTILNNSVTDTSPKNNSVSVLVSTSSGNVLSNCNGRKFYSVGDNHPTTTRMLPQVKHWKCCFNLPYGLEPAISRFGELYFLDYNTSTTTNYVHYEFNSPDKACTNQKDDKFSYSKISTTIAVNQHLSNLDWSSVLDEECRIIKPIPPNPNGTALENSNLIKKFKVGDRIVSLNNKSISCVSEVNNAFKCCLNWLNAEMVREFRGRDGATSSFSSENLPGIKSSFLSDLRKANNKINKPSVHFAEKPVILEYQREIEKKRTESNTIETIFNNVIRIKLETGVVKTIKVTHEETVNRVIERVLGKLQYRHLEIFCLALVDSASHNVHYFAQHHKMAKIFKHKKQDVTLECRILVLHPPNDIKNWVTPDWILCFDYLFFQYRNELLSGNVVKNDVMNEKTLLHLIGFVVATDNMVECLSKLEMYIDHQNPYITADDLELNGLGNLNVPSSFLASVDYRIKFLCKSMSTASLSEHVLTIFSDLLPKPFFQLIFAETKKLDDLHFTISRSVFNEFKQITHNAQLAFLQLAIQFNLVGIHRFRVHVVECPGVQLEESLQNGLPFNFYIDFHSGYGITKDTSNFNMLVGVFYSVLAIYVYHNSDGRRVITILTKRECPLTLIANERECDNIVVLMRSICSIKSDEYHYQANAQHYVVPVIDFTDLSYRVPVMELPQFFNYNHLVIPSLWNHCAALEEFTKALWPHFLRFYFKPQHINAKPKHSGSVTDSDTVSLEVTPTSRAHSSNQEANYENIPTALPYLVTLKNGHAHQYISLNSADEHHRSNQNTRLNSVGSDDDDDEGDNLSNNPWIKKMVSADEIDIRRRNSFTTTSLIPKNSINNNNNSSTGGVLLKRSTQIPDLAQLSPAVLCVHNSSNEKLLNSQEGSSENLTRKNDCHECYVVGGVDLKPLLSSVTDDYDAGGVGQQMADLFVDTIICAENSDTTHPKTISTYDTVTDTTLSSNSSIKSKILKAVTSLKSKKKKSDSSRKYSHS